jgi:N-sulfoglucosamine sulfohydrolase
MTGRLGSMTLRVVAVTLGLMLTATAGAHQPASARPPNILVIIADDWAYPHSGAYGDPVVRTPTFDRIAREGVLFRQAYAAAPSCTPSRASLLTGLAPHELAEGGNLWSTLPSRFAVYPDLLEHAGYTVGHTRKGWGPGNFETGGRKRNPAGPQFASFDAFYAQAPKDKPFAFWFGSTDPHRPYYKDTGAAAGLKPEQVRVPAYLPDTPQVRNDLLDYYFEIERLDREAGAILRTLEQAGQLDNTLVVFTSDNGMPFPRAKANLYDGGTHVPLAIRLPGQVKAGQQRDDFVVLTDLAPTILDAARLTPPPMTGRSLMPLLAGGRQPNRDRVFVERERHAQVRRGDLSYPARAVRTERFLYIRNFRPDRWPAGDPEMYFAVGPFGDIDGGPSKDLLLERRNDPATMRFFELATAKRAAEELYDLKKDPDQLQNVAGQREYESDQKQLKAMLEEWMRDTHDPRISQDDDRWDEYPYYGNPGK